MIYRHAALLPARPMNRRDLLDTLAKAGLVAALPNWKLTAVEVTYEPGEVDTPHKHPGFVFGYVIAGTLRFQVDGQPETTFRAGEMFYEAPDSVHRVSANASATQPCRFLAMIFAEKDRPLSVQV